MIVNRGYRCRYDDRGGDVSNSCIVGQVNDACGVNYLVLGVMMCEVLVIVLDVNGSDGSDGDLVVNVVIIMPLM